MQTKKKKKRTIEKIKIKEYLNSQAETSINEIIEQFIDIIKNYSSQIDFLVMKIIPNYSTEGQLPMQSKGFFFFILMV